MYWGAVDVSEFGVVLKGHFSVCLGKKHDTQKYLLIGENHLD